MFPLTQESSSLYIADVNFRATINALLASPSKQITLSLPADLTRNYIANLPTVRENINALLDNPLNRKSALT